MSEYAPFVVLLPICPKREDAVLIEHGDVATAQAQ
jgi:hypothetical protein